MYILKVIERGNEEEGVKFWRFKHNWKGNGPIDKIIPIWRNKGDVTDANEGRDLILILQTLPLPGGRGEYTTVSSVMYEDPGKLSEDQTQTKEWTEDERTWKDVYSQKPVEYLEAISKGLEPVWDSELKKYTYDDPNSVSNSTNTTTLGSINDPQANDPQSQDLPF